MVEGCAWGHPGTTEALGILAAGAGWHALSLPTHRGHFVLVSLGNSRREREAQLFFSPPFPCCLPHQTHPQPLLEASQAVPMAQARTQQKPRQDFPPILEALSWVFNKRLPLLLFTSQPSFLTNVPVPQGRQRAGGTRPLHHQVLQVQVGRAGPLPQPCCRNSRPALKHCKTLGLNCGHLCALVPATVNVANAAICPTQARREAGNTISSTNTPGKGFRAGEAPPKCLQGATNPCSRVNTCSGRAEGHTWRLSRPG